MQIDQEIAFLELGAHRDQVLDPPRVLLERAHVRDRGIEPHQVAVLLLGPVGDTRPGEGAGEGVHGGKREHDVAEGGEPEHRDVAEAAPRRRDPRAGG